MKLLAKLPLLLLLIADAADDDLKKLQGTWTMAALEVDGVNVPPAKIDGATLTIKGERYTVKNKKGQPITCTLRLDPEKKPAEVDMAFAEPGGGEKVLKGIYEISGDTFKVARGLDAKQARPGQLATWPGTTYFVVTWKRADPAP